MIVNAKPDTETLSPLRRAAMLLIVLGEQTASEMLQQLSEDDVQKVSREVARVTSISSEQAENILNDFHHMAVAGDYVARGGIDFARKLLMRAFSPDTAKRMLDRLTKALGADAASFDALQKADPQQLAKFIHNEHPQTIALVLSHLSYSQASSLLTSLPAAMRADVSQRMASLDQISPDIILKIAAVIGSKLKALGEFSRESYGGVRAVAEMLNRLDSTSSREILDHIDQQDTNLAETIRHLMFVFEDLLLIDPMGLKEVLGKADRKALTIALKGTSEQLRNHILSCMSQRGADMLREDMESLGPVKIKEVETAQQSIIAVVRQLESEGVLSPQAVGQAALDLLKLRLDGGIEVGRRSRHRNSRNLQPPRDRQQPPRPRAHHRAAGHRHPRHRCPPALRQRPAHRHFRRQRRRQKHPAWLHVAPQFGRRHSHRHDWRTQPRSPRLPRK